MKKETHVRFDWVIKKLVRDKSDHTILEGFLSEVLRESIKIEKVLESESNQHFVHQKYNRVDLKCSNQKGEVIIIEIQNNYEIDFFHRMLFGASQSIIEHIKLGEEYATVKKVIAISIVYFDLGTGSDYIYRGKNEFTGLHNHDTLQLNDDQKDFFHIDQVYQIFPEYYLLKVNKFDDQIRDTLDQWIYFLKNSRIEEDFDAQGIQKANNELNVMKLSETERKNYLSFVNAYRDAASTILTQKALQNSLDKKSKKVIEQEQQILEQEQQIEQKNQQIEQKDQQIEQKDQQIEQKDKQIKDFKVRMIAYGKVLKDSGADREEIMKQTGLSREEIEQIN